MVLKNGYVYEIWELYHKLIESTWDLRSIYISQILKFLKEVNDSESKVIEFKKSAIDSIVKLYKKTYKSSKGKLKLFMKTINTKLDYRNEIKMNELHQIEDKLRQERHELIKKIENQGKRYNELSEELRQIILETLEPYVSSTENK